MNMELCQNVSVSVSPKQEEQVLVAPSSSSSLDDLFSAQNTEVDVGLEWLSVFVEDCFSSPPSCVIGPACVQAKGIISSKPSSTTLLKKRPQKQNEPSLQSFSVPGKARSKRKRLSAPRTNKSPLSIWSHHLNLNPQNDALISDPPLLKQAYWLADSELIVPKKKDVDDDDDDEEEVKGVMVSKGIEFEGGVSNNNDDGENHQMVVVTRRCSHCLSQRTPQWRAGPLGPKTLCNACGVRYKSGRLLPEYRPAKSPTFVSYLHSNSHKKVMEMRNMAGGSASASASVLHS